MGAAVDLGRKQEVHRGAGSVQVIVEQPRQRRLPLLLSVLSLGELTGVGPQQIVHGVPVRARLLYQVRPDKLIQPAVRVLSGGGGERGGSAGVPIWAGVQAKQAERPDGIGV
jgi:hypothetical protein